ncbi:Uncharacterized protein dnm_026480 [Desulfonema magnum]|uniref:Uncharacterized protein n=1 Tax=Desulfonema magnum TaxID=45655 RepID=A0A975GMF1_9BACT|nr:Uncharacterized protein dnm_026480 [Desulfonema magnum]
MSYILTFPTSGTFFPKEHDCQVRDTSLSFLMIKVPEK